MFANGKRLSNGKIENCNSRLKVLLKAVKGYQNFNRYKNRNIFVINEGTPIKNYHK